MAVSKAMAFNNASSYPEGIISFLDTDLYKLTMQSAVLKYFRDVPVTYELTNRTPDKRLSREAFHWLQDQITKLGNISLSDDELAYLRSHCPYLSEDYLSFLQRFRLRPREQIAATFTPVGPDDGGDDVPGDVSVHITGRWADTILYEIPLLALASEAYFRFVDRDWNYDGQEERAYEKGLRLLEAGCVFSEFGTRRRRDYHTQALVFRGLIAAGKEGARRGYTGKLAGTSNVHFSMRFNLAPIGTVAHEWFMGIAALTDDYASASARALAHWVGAFGEGVLGIALTDTFGTPEFLRAFAGPVVPPPARATDPLPEPRADEEGEGGKGRKTYAKIFTGVRQDSGDPEAYVKMMREFYDAQGITDKKTIVFSDSLNIDKCLEYKKIAEAAGFTPTFGIGTYLTNDFVHTKTGKKSLPLNIVIKLSSAAGRPAVKISDNIGKNTGDRETVDRVKRELGYVEHEWKEGDETARWGKEET